MAAWCNDACATKPHVLHRRIRQHDVLRRGAARPEGSALCAALWTARGRLGSAGVLLCGGVQPEHRQLEHSECFEYVPGMRPCAVARMRRATEVLPQQWSRPQAVPGADVGTAHLGCGRVPAQMWTSPGADVGSVWLERERVLCVPSMNDTWWRVATRLCDEAPLVASLYNAG